jgi:acetylornithine deacetylase/succinyl-diaminopimelate desuccinylase-like protein
LLELASAGVRDDAAFVMNAPASVIELLQTLIRIPSVNPSGSPGTDGIGEQRIAEYTGDFLVQLGAHVELREVLPNRPNVVACFPSDRPGKPKLLFAPHTDTVSVAGMIIDPFGGEVHENRVWGRGASDTKGSMAAMLWALRGMRDLLPGLPYEIWFAGLAGEEAGQQGAKALASEERFDFVIAGEPTELQIVHCHKGCLRLHLTTHGKAVHSASPQLGVNAIYKMVDVVAFIRDHLAAELSAFTHPILGQSTVSVGTIHGGSKSNIVPDRCEAAVDIRTVPAQDVPRFAERLIDRLRSVCLDLEVAVGQSPPLQTDPDHPVIHVLERIGARCIGAPWFCDAAVFASSGAPAIAVGPGSIAQAHTADEWITVDDLARGVNFFVQFLTTLGTKHGGAPSS